MTKEEFFKFHQAFCADMLAISQRKNSDYTGGNLSPFANFTQIGNIIPNAKAVEIGFLTRMSDKMSRIGSYISKGELLVKDESVQDSLKDLANYCILFSGYIQSQMTVSDAAVATLPALTDFADVAFEAHDG